MVGHELAGIATALITGVILISALSKNANTSAVISASTNGFANLLGQISAPVMGQQAA